jgi:hypothetical protein
VEGATMWTYVALGIAVLVFVNVLIVVVLAITSRSTQDD